VTGAARLDPSGALHILAIDIPGLRSCVADPGLSDQTSPGLSMADRECHSDLPQAAAFRLWMASSKSLARTLRTC